MDRAGDAVAFLAWAKEELETLKDSNPSLHIVKGDKEKTKRSQLLDELESTDTFYTYYKKMNDSVSCLSATFSRTPMIHEFTTFVVTLSIFANSGGSEISYPCRPRCSADASLYPA